MLVFSLGFCDCCCSKHLSDKVVWIARLSQGSKGVISQEDSRKFEEAQPRNSTFEASWCLCWCEEEFTLNKPYKSKSLKEKEPTTSCQGFKLAVTLVCFHSFKLDSILLPFFYFGYFWFWLDI